MLFAAMTTSYGAAPPMSRRKRSPPPGEERRASLGRHASAADTLAAVSQRITFDEDVLRQLAWPSPIPQEPGQALPINSAKSFRDMTISDGCHLATSMSLCHQSKTFKVKQ